VSCQDWIHHVPVYVLNTLMFSILSGNVVSLCVSMTIRGGVAVCVLKPDALLLAGRLAHRESMSMGPPYVRPGSRPR